MSDILTAIDAATGCQQCERPLGDSPSDDFCSPRCQRLWFARHGEPLDWWSEDAAPVYPGHDQARWRVVGGAGVEGPGFESQDSQPQDSYPRWTEGQWTLGYGTRWGIAEYAFDAGDSQSDSQSSLSARGLIEIGRPTGPSFRSGDVIAMFAGGQRGARYRVCGEPEPDGFGGYSLNAVLVSDVESPEVVVNVQASEG